MSDKSTVCEKLEVGGGGVKQGEREVRVSRENYLNFDILENT